jgi:hypothetical protein
LTAWSAESSVRTGARWYKAVLDMAIGARVWALAWLLVVVYHVFVLVGF